MKLPKASFICRLLGCLIVVAVLPFQVSRTGADSGVRVDVDLRASEGPFVPIQTWFGYDEPNYTYTANGEKLLAELRHMSPAPVRVRTHNLLTTGDGQGDLKWGSTNAYTENSEGKAVYEWSIVDKIFDAYAAAGVQPMVEIGFMPEAMSVHPRPYHVQFPTDIFQGGWSYPPRIFSAGVNWWTVWRSTWESATENTRPNSGIGKCGTSRTSATGTVRRRTI